MNAIDRIRRANASGLPENRLSEAELNLAANKVAERRGFIDEAALIAKARGIQTGETRDVNRQTGPVFTAPDPVAPVGTGTVLLPDQGVPPVAAARPATPDKTLQELWDEVAAAEGGPAAALRILGVPRPTS